MIPPIASFHLLFIHTADFLKLCLLLMDDQKDDFYSAFENLNSPQKKKPLKSHKDTGVNKLMVTN